jgi:hypothetical protein
MGHMIEEIALERGHEIVCVIDRCAVGPSQSDCKTATAVRPAKSLKDRFAVRPLAMLVVRFVLIMLIFDLKRAAFGLSLYGMPRLRIGDRRPDRPLSYLTEFECKITTKNGDDQIIASVTRITLRKAPDHSPRSRLNPALR